MRIACPQCGGESQPETVDEFVTCAFCGSSLFIDLEAVTPVFTFRPAIESERVSLHLKKDFERIAYGSAVVVEEVEALFAPFWTTAVNGPLQSACAAFPAERIPPPAADRLFFSPPEGPQAPLRMPVDVPPPGGRAGLLLVPFYAVRGRQGERRFLFYVNAVSGTVYGRPRAALDPGGNLRHVALFAGFFLSMLGVNYRFDSGALAVLSNLLLLSLFFLLSELLPATGGKKR